MNANGAVRGSRVGADPLIADYWKADNGRDIPGFTGTAITYVCESSHATTVRFAPLEEPEIPSRWNCATCHQLAGREGTSLADEIEKPYKTPLEYAKERRNDQDVEKILTDALSRLRDKG